MLEICPSIADGPISIKCQPLSMGDREDPARLVFTSKEGHGIHVLEYLPKAGLKEPFVGTLLDLQKVRHVHDIAVQMLEQLRPYLGDRVVGSISRPCAFKKDCMMKMENTQAIQGKTTRPLCKYFPEYLTKIGMSVKDIKDGKTV